MEERNAKDEDKKEEKDLRFDDLLLPILSIPDLIKTFVYHWHIFIINVF